MSTVDLESIEAGVTSEIRRVVGRKVTIPLDAGIWHDLRIGGDDACELLDAIANRYTISFRGMWFPDYFPNETEYGPLWLVKLFGISETERRRFTLRHLVAVVERGRWFEPENSN